MGRESSGQTVHLQRSEMTGGILIVDNCCLAQLIDPDVRQRVESSLKAAAIVAWPSELNLAEALSAAPKVLPDLLDTLRWLANGKPLLPWPFRMLAEIAQTRPADGAYSFTPGGLDHLLNDIDAALRERERAAEAMRDMQTRYRQMHEAARPFFQRELKRIGNRSPWSSVVEFLDEHWNRTDLRQHFAGLLWRALEFSGDVPPVGSLDEFEPWRIALDVEGFGVFERALAFAQAPMVHRADLLQLAYLGLTPQRRFVVSRDGPFLDGARRLLTRRHSGARVLHLEELLALAG